MTARMDTCIYLDEVPLIRVHQLGADADRAALAIEPVLSVFAPLEVLRATLIEALARLDAMAADQ